MSMTPEDLRNAASLIEEAETVATEIANQQSAFEASIAELRNRESELRSEASRLVGGAGSGFNRPRQSRSSSRPRSKASAEDVLKAIGATAGINGTQIANQLGVAPATANRLLKELVANGLAIAEGERRGRKYRLA